MSGKQEAALGEGRSRAGRFCCSEEFELGAVGHGVREEFKEGTLL